MDERLVSMLQKAADSISSGQCFGLAIIRVIKLPGGDWGLEIDYQGPHLNLMAGAARLQHGLNIGIDQFHPIEKVTT